MFECPNLTCTETFPSVEEALEHLSNPSTLCVQRTTTTSINTFFALDADVDDWEWEENDGIFLPMFKLLYWLIQLYLRRKLPLGFL